MTKKRKRSAMPKRTASRRDAAARDDDRALQLAMQMMAIRGKSGQEDRMAAFILKKLRAAGATDAALVIEKPPREKFPEATAGNMVLKLPGNVRGPRRLLSAHIDTVPVCVGSQPVQRGNRIASADPNTGLGADDRAGAAVVLSTALRLLNGETPHPPVTFLWTVQEEVGMVGARQLRLGNLGRPKLAFNFDGGPATKLTIGATGGYRMAIRITGLASHAGNSPQEGVSAIAIASLAIAHLHTHGWHGLVEKNGHVGTSNVGVIEGGVATNVVTDRVLVHAEARSHDSAFRQRIVREIEDAFRRAAKTVTNPDGYAGKVEFDGALDYEAFRLPLDCPSVVAAVAAIEAVGEAFDYAVTNGGLDANWLTARGIPTVSLGCGQQNIHSVDEELDVSEFQLARRIAWQIATTPI